MERLLNREKLSLELDEQIVFDQLKDNENAVWSLLLAGGYLKVDGYRLKEDTGKEIYDLSLTNKEISIMFCKLIRGWFSSVAVYNDFINAMLAGDIKSMNAYMNRVALAAFSYFDSGNKPSADAEPERFYHGFVLGLIVELAGRYAVASNRESGYGRYDVMLEPLREQDIAIILEFKVRESEEEKTLKETAEEALAQTERKRYAAALEAKGIARERIRRYGFAFEGKKVLILADA